MLDRFEQWERRRNLAPNTVRDRHNRLGQLHDFAGVDLLDITPENIEQWLDSLPIVPSSRSVYIRAINAFYTFCVREGFLLSIPVDRVTRPRVPRRLPRPVPGDDVAMLMRQAAHDPRLQVMLALASYAGLRRAEIAALQTDEVDMRARAIVVVGGKGDKDRRLPMHDEVERTLRCLPLPDHGFVLTKVRGHGGLTPGSVGTYLSRHLRACGVRSVPHKLRHFFVTEVHEKSGGDLRVAQEAAGHASPSTTAIYAAHSTQRLEIAVWAVGATGCGGCPIDGEVCPVGKV